MAVETEYADHEVELQKYRILSALYFIKPDNVCQ